jgi:phosphoribosylformylglycinamidine cyclo-ligase
MDYRSSGVDIDAGNRAVELIKPVVKKTFSPKVLGGLGGFAACYELPKGYQEPVLVSCTDGVGTKLKFAIDYGIFDTVGIDLVAMCVNDLICTGAKPLYFLDYVACHKLDPAQMKLIIDGMVSACLETGVSLVGGEMAEMNDLYRRGEFDLAGFSVGVVEKSKMLDGSQIRPGCKVYGMASSGLHSNGFSLARKVLSPAVCERFGLTPRDLMTPTRLYVKPLERLMATGNIVGVAHITGGGLVENVSRVLPERVSVRFDRSQLPVPRIFSVIQEAGNVSREEMDRVFNMGVGLVVISDGDLPESDDFKLIGEVVS